MLKPASDGAAEVVELWWWLFAIAGVVTLIVTVLLIVGPLRPRSADDAPTRRARMFAVGGGVAATVGLLLVVFGLSLGSETRHPAAEADVTVEVIGHRFWWEIRYLDRDGAVRATTANELHLPLDATVEVRVRTVDVIHSFWVPALAGKIDLIPGRTNRVRLKPTRIGVFRGQCAEFCGVQHALMALLAVVESEADFGTWLARQAVPADPPAGEAARRGLVVLERTACGACHTVRGTNARGRLGPDLTHLASRRTLAAGTLPNTPGHLAGWIADPQSIKPGSNMPASALPGDDLRALLEYLEGLR